MIPWVWRVTGAIAGVLQDTRIVHGDEARVILDAGRTLEDFRPTTRRRPSAWLRRPAVGCCHDRVTGASDRLVSASPRTPVTTVDVVRDIGERFLLGHGDWARVILDIEHAARTIEFAIVNSDDAFCEVDARLRACRIAHELLTYLQLGDAAEDKSKARIVEMANTWLAEWTHAMGYDDDDPPNHPDGRDSDHIFYPATRS